MVFVKGSLLYGNKNLSGAILPTSFRSYRFAFYRFADPEAASVDEY